MKKLVLASNNAGKLTEFREILAEMGIEVISPKEAGFSSFDVEEDGATFEENALIKARAGVETWGLPTIADDSGLTVDALDGAPGVYSARYGDLGSDGERIAFLLKNMEGVTDRGAQFVCVIACVMPDGREITARGELAGSITDTPRGIGGFGYDSVFEPLKTGKTVAELSAEEKNRISHRAKALTKLKAELEELI